MISKDLRIRSAETSPITRLGGDTKKTSTCCRKRAVISRLSRTQKPEVAASNCTPWQCVLSTLFLPLNGKCLSIVEGPCPHFSYYSIEAGFQSSGICVYSQSSEMQRKECRTTVMLWNVHMLQIPWFENTPVKPELADIRNWCHI